MSAARTRNLAASVQQRLLNRAQQAGEEFQITLNNFLHERFLYRLGRSPVRTKFVLKGALLFRVWADIPYRATLARAIGATFERRKTPFPDATPEGLTDAYWDHQGREAHLRAFARRTRVSADLPKARSLLPLLRRFLLPPLAAARSAQPFNQHWAPGGPWKNVR